MLLLISPAKTLDFDQTDLKKKTKLRFLSESQELIDILKKKSASDLKQLMKVSDKIANLNVERYHNFKTPFSLKNAKQAILAFRGDVYTGLDADSFDEADLAFAQDHLRILSGLYGLIRPLDLMQPYRLEMGTKLQNDAGKNLYEFWDDKLTTTINKDVKKSKAKAIINLASKEYFSAVQPKLLQSDLYNVHFKEEKNDQFKIVAFFAKKARGMMCHYIIKNKLTEPEHLIGFDYDRYTYNEKLSSERDIVFTR
ncbi:MAG: peroxide stress protein YaaA [Saprospiraceae bacterium]